MPGLDRQHPEIVVRHRMIGYGSSDTAVAGDRGLQPARLMRQGGFLEERFEV
jgi:hypothetical protein